MLDEGYAKFLAESFEIISNPIQEQEDKVNKALERYYSDTIGDADED